MHTNKKAPTAIRAQMNNENTPIVAPVKRGSSVPMVNTCNRLAAADSQIRKKRQKEGGRAGMSRRNFRRMLKKMGYSEAQQRRILLAYGYQEV